MHLSTGQDENMQSRQASVGVVKSKQNNFIEITNTEEHTSLDSCGVVRGPSTRFIERNNGGYNTSSENLYQNNV